VRIAKLGPPVSCIQFSFTFFFSAIGFRPQLYLTCLMAGAVVCLKCGRYTEGLENVKPPIEVDATLAEWGAAAAASDGYDVLIGVNVTHISPPEASEGILAQAGKLLRPAGVLLL
jgi:hypothetical protein